MILFFLYTFSLFENFPDFEQKDTRIAVFGNTTIKAATENGLRVDIKAPTPETPSMTMALEKYIKEVNGWHRPKKEWLQDWRTPRAIWGGLKYSALLYR